MSKKDRKEKEVFTSALGKRKHKPTYKINEALALKKEPIKREVWCTVELQTKNGPREYVVSSRFLEDENGDPVSEADLHFENKIIWKSKGKPYEATVLEVNRERKCGSQNGFSDKDDDDYHYDNNSNSDEIVTDEEVVSIPSSPITFTTDIREKTTPVKSKKVSIPSPLKFTCEKPKKTPKTKHTESGFPVPFSHPPMHTKASNLDSNELKEQLNRIESKLDNYICSVGSVGKYERSKMHEANEVKVEESEDDERFTTANGVKLLKLRSGDIGKYALTIMDALFSDEEMGSSSFPPSKSSKPCLDQNRVDLMEECIKKVYGAKRFDDNIDKI